MRYIPNTNGGAEAWAGHRRPPLDALPADIAAACREIDTLAEQMHAAARVVSELKAKDHDDAAHLADRDEAVKAARAGKPMPPAKNRDALAAKRDDARRRHEALVGALEQAINDGDTLRWNHSTDDAKAKVAADHAKRREELLTKAGELADLLAAAIAARATIDWCQSGSYQPRPVTWWADVNPALPATLGINRDAAGTVDARDVIRSAIEAVMEEQQ